MFSGRANKQNRRQAKMTKTDIKNKLIFNRNNYVSLANSYLKNSKQLNDYSWNQAKELVREAETLEEILYHGFNYKFDDSIYTKYRTKELLKEVDTDWKTDCKYPYFNVYEDEVYLTQNVHGIPSIA
tara:strand:+ start:755 stop:1135 length:381 start_codon:yes stop_codon:yes gene_type:complete